MMHRVKLKFWSTLIKRLETEQKDEGIRRESTETLFIAEISSVGCEKNRLVDPRFDLYSVELRILRAELLKRLCWQDKHILACYQAMY